jgi:transposase
MCFFPHQQHSTTWIFHPTWLLADAAALAELLDGFLPWGTTMWYNHQTYGPYGYNHRKYREEQRRTIKNMGITQTYEKDCDQKCRIMWYNPKIWENIWHNHQTYGNIDIHTYIYMHQKYCKHGV